MSIAIFSAKFYPDEEIVVFSATHLAEAEMKASLMAEKRIGYPVLVTPYNNGN